MKITTSRYETETVLNQYVLFHYGEDHDLLPYAPIGPKNSLHFPIRCVTECLDLKDLPANATALEIGCAVGRSSFELSKYCKHVLAIDQSHMFITAAKEMQQTHELKYQIIEEGTRKVERTAYLPPYANPKHVDFRCCNAMDLLHEKRKFDVVLTANVLCRVYDPKAFLNLFSSLVAKKGQFILISPYSWLEEYTPKSHWLGNKKKPLEYIKDELHDYFELQRYFDMPFLIREHFRKYEWGISQASIWRRR
jgi:putative 4-mercaptohistidine N1-methyltranferase